MEIVRASCDKKKFFGMFLAIVILVIMFCHLSMGAFGVASEYFKGNPLKIAAGETRDIQFGRLQNIGNEDIKLKAEIIEGKEIATLSSLEYLVPAGTTNTTINMRVSIPEKTVKEEYTIKVRFLDVTPSKAEGTVIIAKSLTKSIQVLVQEGKVGERKEKKEAGKEELKETKEKSYFLFALLVFISIAIAVLIVTIFFIKRRKK